MEKSAARRDNRIRAPRRREGPGEEKEEKILDGLFTLSHIILSAPKQLLPRILSMVVALKLDDVVMTFSLRNLVLLCVLRNATEEQVDQIRGWEGASVFGTSYEWRRFKRRRDRRFDLFLAGVNSRLCTRESLVKVLSGRLQLPVSEVNDRLECSVNRGPRTGSFFLCCSSKEEAADFLGQLSAFRVGLLFAYAEWADPAGRATAAAPAPKGGLPVSGQEGGRTASPSLEVLNLQIEVQNLTVQIEHLAKAVRDSQEMARPVQPRALWGPSFGGCIPEERKEEEGPRGLVKEFDYEGSSDENEADMRVRDRRSREEETPTFKSPLRKKEKGSTPHEVKEEVAIAGTKAGVGCNQ